MSREIQDADPRRLAELIDFDPRPAGASTAAELADLLRFQLAAALAVDLEPFGPGLCRRFAQAATASGVGPPVTTFADLFAHPDPPAELLDLVRQFAKHARQDAGGPLPTDLASVLYYLAIGLALTRCGRRISRLDASALRRGVAWVRGREWVSPEIVQALAPAAELLAGEPNLERFPEV